MSRLSIEQWALGLAALTAQRSTCLRRQVGCVLLNGRNHVIATGYNGVAAGQPHCNEMVADPIYGPERVERLGGEMTRIRECLGFNDSYPHACPAAEAPSGTLLDGCHAIHAEQNALLQCRDVYSIKTCFCTTSPCVTCVKLLLNTSCRQIVFRDAYSHPEARDLWLGGGGARMWAQV